MKTIKHKMIECSGFDAHEIIERWEVGEKWYEKRTTQYIHRGTISTDCINIEWTVATFDRDPKGELYCNKIWLRDYWL